MNRRLVTEAALDTARRLLAAFRDRFAEAEWPAAFGTCFDIARAGIEGYAAEQERLRRWRLAPDPAANHAESRDG
jgi:hypothetical protein